MHEELVLVTASQQTALLLGERLRLPISTYDLRVPCLLAQTEPDFVCARASLRVALSVPLGSGSSVWLSRHPELERDAVCGFHRVGLSINRLPPDESVSCSARPVQSPHGLPRQGVGFHIAVVIALPAAANHAGVTWSSAFRRCGIEAPGSPPLLPLGCVGGCPANRITGHPAVRL